MTEDTKPPAFAPAAGAAPDHATQLRNAYAIDRKSVV